MRITKRQLKQLIQEELESLLYEEEKKTELPPWQRDSDDDSPTSMADIKQGVAHAREQGQSGFSSYSGEPGTMGMRHKTEFSVMGPGQRAAMQARKATPAYKASAAKARKARDQKRLKQKVEEVLETVLEEGVGGELWQAAQRGAAKPSGQGGFGGQGGGPGDQLANLMRSLQGSLGGGGGDVDMAALQRGLGGGGGGSVPTFGQQGGLSIGGPGGAVHARHGAPPDIFSGLMNYKFPGADKMPWEINPELMRAMFPKGMPNPFIPGAGSDDPAYAATYPEGQGDANYPYSTTAAPKAQAAASSGFMPGEWAPLADLQPEVRTYEPPPQKTTDKRSWTHAPPEKKWSYNPPEKKWSTQHSWEGPLNQVNEQQIQDFVKAFMNKP
jgi:hypothetical protein